MDTLEQLLRKLDEHGVDGGAAARRDRDGPLDNLDGLVVRIRRVESEGGSLDFGI